MFAYLKFFSRMKGFPPEPYTCCPVQTRISNTILRVIDNMRYAQQFTVNQQILIFLRKNQQ